MLSSVANLLGGDLRDQFVHTEKRPMDENLKVAFKVQRRLCIGFFVTAGLGLAFTIASALVFGLFYLGDAGASWMAIAAEAWPAVVLTWFVATYGAMQKAKIMFEPLQQLQS